jgi:hypothetical protein
MGKEIKEMTGIEAANTVRMRHYDIMQNTCENPRDTTSSIPARSEYI